MKNLHDIKPGISVTFWATQDGRKIPFEKLSDEHIMNIFRKFANVSFVNEERRQMLLGVLQEHDRRQEKI